MPEITENQKRIYNQHLSTYKHHQNKPYTLRENFDEFAEKDAEHYQCLIKLDNFFYNHKYVNRKLFFDAPYVIYEDREFFDLCFYNSQAAIKCYTLYIKQLEEQSPDGKSQLEFISDSLKFIRDYCIERKVHLIDYFKLNDCITSQWGIDFVANNVSIYVLLGFEYFNIPIKDMMIGMPQEERELFFENALNNYALYKEKLGNSKKAKKLVIEGIKAIDKNINENLQSI
jgi:hypothetical protein